MSQNQGFDLGGLLKQVLGGGSQAAAPGSGGSGAAGLLSGGAVGKLMPMLMGMVAGGGLSKLMGQLHGGGLGDQAKSWVSADQPNAPVTGDQLTQALGPETVQHFAAQTGMSQDEAAKAMADVLPQVVNAATPQGQVPENMPMPDLSNMQSHINKLIGDEAPAQTPQEQQQQQQQK
jgi:uncharacterized protein YidB (DUF937 family)